MPLLNYWIFGIILLFLIVLFLINSFRRRRIIRKISAMSMDDKLEQLNRLAEPFGYTYDQCQNVFTSIVDAWQKDFGYIAFYNRIASRFNMVFDTEPIFFYYNGKTWLIELWKGQYGINIGCEIGIYYVDRIVPRKNLRQTLFYAVSADDMLPLAIHLIRGDTSLARLSERHWWLTAFRMGTFSRRRRLNMDVSITFPNQEMQSAFIQGMMELGYGENDMSLCGLQLFFTFNTPHAHIRGIFQPLFRFISQMENRFFCWIYLFVTRSFCLTADRLMYLYYYLPFAFRRMICLRRFKKRKRRS